MAQPPVPVHSQTAYLFISIGERLEVPFEVGCKSLSIGLLFVPAPHTNVSVTIVITLVNKYDVRLT